VLFFDEARFGAKPEVARQWASRGKRPRAVVLPGYENFFWYAAVAPRGGESFVLELPWVDAEMVSLYLDRLAAAFPGRRILLIWDRAGTHVARGVRVPERIHLLSLPAYSPELNPVEHLWPYLRRHACRNRLFRSLAEIKQALAAVFRRLTPDRLASICHCNYLSCYN
jgi:transposase